MEPRQWSQPHSYVHHTWNQGCGVSQPHSYVHHTWNQGSGVNIKSTTQLRTAHIVVKELGRHQTRIITIKGTKLFATNVD